MLVRYIIAEPLLFLSPSYVPSFYFDTSIFFLNKLKFSLRKTVLALSVAPNLRCIDRRCKHNKYV